MEESRLEMWVRAQRWGDPRQLSLELISEAVKKPLIISEPGRDVFKATVTANGKLGKFIQRKVCMVVEEIPERRSPVRPLRK